MFDFFKYIFCGCVWILYFLIRCSFFLGSCFFKYLIVVNEFVYRIIGNFNYFFFVLDILDSFSKLGWILGFFGLVRG